MRSVRITSDTGLASGTKVTDAETGAEVKGVTAVDIRIRPDEVITAEIAFGLVDVSTTAAARFLIPHPITGDITEVSEIVFADGSRVTL